MITCSRLDSLKKIKQVRLLHVAYSVCQCLTFDLEIIEEGYEGLYLRELDCNATRQGRE